MSDKQLRLKRLVIDQAKQNIGDLPEDLRADLYEGIGVILGEGNEAERAFKTAFDLREAAKSQRTFWDTWEGESPASESPLHVPIDPKEMRAWRLSRGLTQEEAAELLGVTRPYYNEVEDGKQRGGEGFWVRATLIKQGGAE